MKPSPYTLQSKPGALLEASRNPKMKRAVMKAIGMPMKPKKRKGSMSLVKSPSANLTQTKRRKGTMGMVTSPKANMNLRTKKAKKGTSGRSFGDEKLQALSLEHADESKKDFRKASKRRKAPHAHKNLGKFAHKRKAAKKKSA